MNELIISARDVMRRRCSEIDGNLKVDLARCVLDFQTGLNVHGIFTINGIANTLWERIAKVPGSEGVSAFLDGAAEFRFRNGLTYTKWKDLLNLIRDVCGLKEESAQPKEGPAGIYERTQDATMRLALISSHDWLVFLILLLLAEPIMSPEEIKAHTALPEKE